MAVAKIPPSIVWFRLDLRLEDNPALQAAVERGHPVIPVYIWAPEEEIPWQPGAASKWWLHHSLASLQTSLQVRGAKLLLLKGESLQQLRRIIRETGADAIYWNRRYEPALISRDQKIKDQLRKEGLKVESFNSALINEPWTIQNQSGKPFQVFTPYWKCCVSRGFDFKPSSAPASIYTPSALPASLNLEELELEPKLSWKAGLESAWQPGEAHAQRSLTRFIDHALQEYESRRDFPADPATSRLSPYLHFGEISPARILHELQQATTTTREQAPAKSSWMHTRYATEVGWRDFAHHLLFHFPRTPSEPLRPAFQRFPWRKNEEWLSAWKKGRTGVPLVDAGMRELWATGWMHNRVRMVVASYLVKNLLISWQEGARWFWDTLVDADLASNTMGWQWAAGCGADAAPYFRIFNPTTQAQKFDEDGAYIRRWVPELSSLRTPFIHEPWSAPDATQKKLRLPDGSSYPEPLVSHTIAREVALEAYASIQS